MSSLEKIYQSNVGLLTQLNIRYAQWQHEPILDFVTDERVARELGWSGTHSKSLFLKLKGGDYALYLTDKDSRLDTKAIKAATGKRPSICSDEEMTRKLGCVPGAVCPFGMPEQVSVIVDTRLYQHPQVLYTPGYPDMTFGISGAELANVLQALPNPLYEI